MEEKKLDKDINVHSKDDTDIVVGMTDEQIIKALKCCTVDEVTDCENCPLLRESCAIIRKYALDLINRQKAKIERLTEELEMKKKECREIADDYQEMGTSYYNETVKTTELQKQVDELTDKLGKVLLGVKADELLVAKGIEQAVKDTAKEIYNEINYCIKQGQEYCGLDWRGLLTAKNVILVYCKKKGVEVE